jgi:hypothetical protein
LPDLHAGSVTGGTSHSALCLIKKGADYAVPVCPARQAARYPMRTVSFCRKSMHLFRAAAAAHVLRVAALPGENQL